MDMYIPIRMIMSGWNARYSYRAAMYQSEFQMKTAGSFLLRVEPFYRNLGGQSGSMIPAAYDLTER